MNIRDNENIEEYYKKFYHANGIFPDNSCAFPDAFSICVKETISAIKLYIAYIFKENPKDFNTTFKHLIHQIGFKDINITAKNINVRERLFEHIVFATSFIQQLFQGFHNNNLNNDKPDINFTYDDIDILQSYLYILHTKRLCEINLLCNKLKEQLNEVEHIEILKPLDIVVDSLKSECKNHLNKIDAIKNKDDKIKSIDTFFDWLCNNNDDDNNIIISEIDKVIKEYDSIFLGNTKNSIKNVLKHFSNIIKKRLNNDMETFNIIKNDKKTTTLSYEYCKDIAILNNNNNIKLKAANESKRLYNTKVNDLITNDNDFREWSDKIKKQIIYK